MKYFEISEDHVYFIQSKQTYPLTELVKSEVVTLMVQKSRKEDFLNAGANLLSNSIANGNELVDVCVKVTLKKHDPEYIVLSKMPVVRNNLDYHHLVREARTLQETIKKMIASLVKE